MNQEKLDRSVAQFKERYPDFESFDKPGQEYSLLELDYKRDLAAKFSPIAKRLVEGSGGAFFDELKDLLTRTKLKALNKPQNLISWIQVDNFFKEVNIDNTEKKARNSRPNQKFINQCYRRIGLG